MDSPGSAASQTSKSARLSHPKIHETARVHAFSNIVGDVCVGAHVAVAPGAAIRADAGSPFSIGDGSRVQDGAVIHGLEEGRVLGDDQQEYSVWVGENVTLTHFVLIHGPAYIGNNCFIGFRSTVFNARLGDNCIVLMHALIQDVEIPPGKLVPSGAVITSQQQADALPDVQSQDRTFVRHLSGVKETLQSQDQANTAVSQVTAVRHQLEQIYQADTPEMGQSSQESSRQVVGSMKLHSEVTEQVQQLLSQGYRISTEYADKRRFQTSSWQTGEAISASRTSDVLAALEEQLAGHDRDYVRLIGVDPRSKRRVAELMIHRPGQQNGSNGNGASYRRSSNNRSSNSYSSNSYSSNSYSYSSSSSAGYTSGSGGHSLSQEAVDMVRQLLAQGYRIGTEHADKRRFRTSTWTSCAPIASSRPAEVTAALEDCMAEHDGEYVRMLGIDTRSKRRVAELMIQRPDGNKSTGQSSRPAGSYRGGANSNIAAATASGTGSLSLETVELVEQLLSQGYRVGIEHADKRRFRINSWASCATVHSSRPADVIEALEVCITEHEGEYVRMLGVDTQSKRRVAELIIQRPEDAPARSSANRSSSSSYSSYASSYKANSSNGKSSEYFVPKTGKQTNQLSSDAVNQVRQFLAQGYRIGMEHADKRRFRINSWASCTPVSSTRPAEVIASLEDCMAEHSGEYVRILGIDPQAKRRVGELIIQRP